MSAQNTPLGPFHDSVLAHINPNFVAAGRPWLPGVCVNPGGRPSYKRLSDAILRKLDESGEDGSTKADQIADAMVTGAIKGDVTAATFVRDTTEGRPAQQINLDGNLLIESADERKQRMLAVLTALAGLSEEP